MPEHTSTTEPEDDKFLTVRPGLAVPLEEFEFTYMRSSGPGGQNVNKVNTKARLRWAIEDSESLPTGVKARFTTQYRTRITQDGDFIITSQRYRDQARNVADCLEKLRELIESVADAPVPRKRKRPTKGMKERRLRKKKQRSERKQSRRPPTLPD